MNKRVHQKRTLRIPMTPRNPRDVSGLQITGKVLSNFFNFQGTGTATRGKSDTVVDRTTEKLSSFKDILDRYKKPDHGKVPSRLLFSYLQDAKSSLKIDTKLDYLKSPKIKKYNYLSLAEIEALLKEEKIDPSLALLLKSADKFNVSIINPALPSNISASVSPSVMKSVWSASDTVLTSKPQERLKADTKQKKDIFSVESLLTNEQSFGNVPLAGRLVTDKGTYTAIGLSTKTHPAVVTTAKVPEALISAADDMINKVELFVENPPIAKIQENRPVFGIRKTATHLTDIQPREPQLPVVGLASQTMENNFMQRSLTPKFDSVLQAKVDSAFPEKFYDTKSQPQHADYKDEMQKFKLDLKKPSLLVKETDPIIQNFKLHKDFKPEKNFFIKKKSSGKFPSFHKEQYNLDRSQLKTNRPLVVNEEFQDMIITGKELPSFSTIASVEEKTDELLLRKSQKAYEDEQITKLLEDEIACAEALQEIWDAYEKENQISEEIPTTDLESFVENAQATFEDYFNDRKDKTGQLMKYVTFSLKNQNKISLEQAMLLMKEALVDPQMAQLLMMGKKDDFITKLKLSNLASKLRGEDTRPFDVSEAEKDNVVGDEGEQLQGAETTDGKSSLNADAVRSKIGVAGEEFIEEGRVTEPDGMATEPKDMTAEELALMKATEAEKLRKSDSSITDKVPEDAPSNERSDIVSSPDITSMNDVLRKEVEMPTRVESSAEITSEIDSAISKGGVTVPDSVDSVDSKSTAVTMVDEDSSVAGTTEDGITLSIEGLPTVSTEGLPTASTECLPTASTEGFLTASTEGLSTASINDLPTASIEGLPSASVDGLSSASTDGLRVVSTEGVPAVSEEGLPALSEEGLPALSEEGLPAPSLEGFPTVSIEDAPTVSTEGAPSISVTPEDVVSASNLDVPSKEHFKDDTSSVVTDRSQLALPSLRPTISKEDLVKVDQLLAKYDTSAASSEESVSGVSTISGAYEAMNTDGSLMKISETSSQDKIAADSQRPEGSMTAEDAFERARRMTQKLSQKYGLEENSMLPPGVSHDERKTKRKSFISGEKPSKLLKKKSVLKDHKPLPDIGSVKPMTSLETSDEKTAKFKKKKSFLVDQEPLPDIGSSKQMVSFENKFQESLESKLQEPLETFETKIPSKSLTALKSVDEVPQAEKPEKLEKPGKSEKPGKLSKKSQSFGKKKGKKKESDHAEFAAVFKDKEEKDRFLEIGLDKIITMAKEHKLQKKKEYDLSKKQFRDPIEVRDSLHARREQLHMLIMEMRNEKGVELDTISQNELFEELETFEDEEINETLSMLTKVLHLEVDDTSSKQKPEEQEIPKKEDKKMKEIEIVHEIKEEEKLEEIEEEEEDAEDEEIEEKNVIPFKDQTRDMEPYKIQTGKPVVTATLPESSEKSLDEQLFQNALLKMKTLNIFNAIKSLGITNPQMKDFDDYIAQNKLAETMDPVEIVHLRRAASEMFLFKAKARKGRKKSVKSVKPKDLKKIRTISDTQVAPKTEKVCAPVDLERIEKKTTLATMKQELDMLSFELRFTEPHVFSYYVVWPEPPKPQKKPNKRKK